MDRRAPGQVLVTFEYSRHTGGSFQHGGVILRFDSLQPYSFESRARWPADNDDAQVRAAVESVLLERYGALDKSRIVLEGIVWDDTYSSALGFERAARAAAENGFYGVGRDPKAAGRTRFPIHVMVYPMSALLHPDGLRRCPWPQQDPLYVAYHDDEWGVPECNDRALYEKLILDGFQAGLSWITILRKRDNFRRAFDGFEPEKIARYDARKVAALMNDAGIVRNRAKIEGAIASARAYLDIMDKGPGFSPLLWDFVDGRPQINHRRRIADVPAETPVSRAMSKELAGRGFKFVGPTIVYAFMQAVGMVNDHLLTCHRHPEATKGPQGGLA